MEQVLKDCLVLDLSRLLPGPYCSMMLADFGARVICIEDRRFENESLPEFQGVNRNKEHMALNLKSDKGKAIFYKLAEKADVILEGFRPGTAKKLGVGYEDIFQINPAVVYCSISGYGQNGPLKNQAGHDVNFLGESGVLSLIGEKNRMPQIPGIQIADLTGGMYGVIGILLALHAREKTGKGEYIDISMTDALISLLPYAAGCIRTYGNAPERGNAQLSHRFACYNVYETADGKYITLGALEPRFWENVCEYFGVPEYIPHQFDEEKKEEIIEYFKSRFIQKSKDEWIDEFVVNTSTDFCIGGVNEAEEALTGENAAARKMVITCRDTDGDTFSALGNPVKLENNPPTYRSAPPSFGRDTNKILEELGLTRQEILELKESNIV